MRTRVIPFTVLLIIVFLGLWLRLGWLQLVKLKENQALAEENRIKVVYLAADRGIIYDRHDQVLVRNRPEGRHYPYSDALAHVLGYLGEADEADLEIIDLTSFDYIGLPDQELSIIVGKLGIERYYDARLRGRDGGILVETDTQGEIVREIRRVEPQVGESLKLNIDLELQQKAFDLLDGRKGAVVATVPQTGEVLALASSPSFNPHKVEDYLEDESRPMFNRAITGLYPPGSVFKIVTAVAGLEEEVIDKALLVEDTGELRIGQFVFGNWYYRQYGQTEGMVDILKAIKRSNDIYFYKVGEWLGISRLVNWSKFFGLDSPLGIDIPGEAAGLVPTPEWKKENKLERWYLGDTYITAIGQGNLQLTVLQTNQLASIIAANGNFCKPHLLKDNETDCHDLKISSENLSLVKEGMKQACQDGGTAWSFFDFQPQVGCKTGTAEFGDPEDKTHAWFTVFAPIDESEIVVTVLLEEAGEGSAEAAPVALEILKHWFKEK